MARIQIIGGEIHFLNWISKSVGKLCLSMHWLCFGGLNASISTPHWANKKCHFAKNASIKAVHSCRLFSHTFHQSTREKGGSSSKWQLSALSLWEVQIWKSVIYHIGITYSVSNKFLIRVFQRWACMCCHPSSTCICIHGLHLFRH